MASSVEAKKPAKKRSPKTTKQSRTSKLGQPTKCTKERTRKIAARIQQTGHVTAAVRTAGGIDPSTHADWLAKGARGIAPYCDYSEAIARAKQQFEEKLVKELATSQKHTKYGSTPVGSDRQFLLRAFNPEQFNTEYKVKVMDDANEQILERLKAALDGETFAKVVRALVAEGE